jgi:hypothetical protein
MNRSGRVNAFGYYDVGDASHEACEICLGVGRQPIGECRYLGSAEASFSGWGQPGSIFFIGIPGFY